MPAHAVLMQSQIPSLVVFGENGNKVSGGNSRDSTDHTETPVTGVGASGFDDPSLLRFGKLVAKRTDFIARNAWQ